MIVMMTEKNKWLKIYEEEEYEDEDVVDDNADCGNDDYDVKDNDDVDDGDADDDVIVEIIGMMKKATKRKTSL
jgi:hypothetical protein